MLIFDNFCWHQKLEVGETQVSDTTCVIPLVRKNNTLFGH